MTINRHPKFQDRYSPTGLTCFKKKKWISNVRERAFGSSQKWPDGCLLPDEHTEKGRTFAQCDQFENSWTFNIINNLILCNRSVQATSKCTSAFHFQTSWWLWAIVRSVCSIFHDMSDNKQIKLNHTTGSHIILMNTVFEVQVWFRINIQLQYFWKKLLAGSDRAGFNTSVGYLHQQLIDLGPTYFIAKQYAGNIVDAPQWYVSWWCEKSSNM